MTARPRHRSMWCARTATPWRHVKAAELQPARRTAGCISRSSSQGAPVALSEARIRPSRPRSDLPVLVDFWAPLVRALQMAPHFSRRDAGAAVSGSSGRLAQQRPFRRTLQHPQHPDAGPLRGRARSGAWPAPWARPTSCAGRSRMPACSSLRGLFSGRQASAAIAARTANDAQPGGCRPARMEVGAKRRHAVQLRAAGRHQAPRMRQALLQVDHFTAGPRAARWRPFGAIAGKRVVTRASSRLRRSAEPSAAR